MKYVEAGGLRLSAIGLGCWQFGSRDWGYGKTYGEKTAAELVHGALDLGVNLIDTAEVYARGRVEAIVGRGSRGTSRRGVRRDEGAPGVADRGRVEEHGRLSALRLGVECIDLYQVHWPNPLVPLHSTMAGMRRLQDAGIVRHVGVSNFSRGPVGEGRERRSAGRSRRTRCTSACSTASPSDANVPYAQAHDRVVIAYSPLEQGVLGGRYDATHLRAGSRRGATIRCASPRTSSARRR